MPNNMVSHGKFDIPEWALCYLENGDVDNLEEDEIAVANAWIEEHFPNGYYMEIDWEDYNELDFYPAFGTRNKNAFTDRGESPFLGCKTYKVEFYTDK